MKEPDRDLQRLLGAGAVQATRVLSELLNDQVRIENSRLYFGGRRDALIARLRERGELLTVKQAALGRESLRVSLAIGNRHVRALLNMLMGRYGGLSPWSLEESGGDGSSPDPVELDALKETANMVTGSCAQVLASEFGLARMSLPSLATRSSLEEEVKWLLPDPDAVCAESELRSSGRGLELQLMISLCPAIGPA